MDFDDPLPQLRAMPMKHNGWSINPRHRKLIEEFWNRFEFCELSDAALLEQLDQLQQRVSDALYGGDLKLALSLTFEAMHLMADAGEDESE